MDARFEILRRPARASAVRLLEEARLPAVDLTDELVDDHARGFFARLGYARAGSAFMRKALA